MILLDTDHLSVLVDEGASKHQLLLGRIRTATDPALALPIVSVEEQMRGWLAQIKRWPEVAKQVGPYARFWKFLEFLRRWNIVPLDQSAAVEFNNLRKQRVRLGTQDLKIASIALVHNALLLSANIRDFSRVPGLKVESWLG